MARRISPIGHEDRLSIVEHLDELRTRLIVCVAAIVVCFAFTYWQNDAVLKAVNKPFTDSQRINDSSKDDRQTGGDTLAQEARFYRNIARYLRANEAAGQAQQNVADSLAERDDLPAATVATIRRAAQAGVVSRAEAGRVLRTLPDTKADKPVTFGVTEPFLTTFTVAGYAALLLALPLILFQLYAFLLPAFSPKEKKVAVPFMLMVPVLFICGVAFAYFIALPRAVDFLLNFNDDAFNVLVGAQQYYKFSIILMAAVGLLFQIPVAVLAVTRLGIVTPKTLSKNRGYVVLVVAVVAAVATPTPDPVTMLVTMAPLIVLFELSLLLARIFPPKEGEGLLAGRFDGWDDDDEDDDEDWDEPVDPEGDPYGFNDVDDDEDPEQLAGTPQSGPREA